MTKKYILLSYFIICTIISINAQSYLFFDNAKLFSKEQKEILTQRISSLYNTTGIEINVQTIVNKNKPMFEYAKDFIQKYGLGDKLIYNGLLITISTESEQNEIVLGYGLEWSFNLFG